MRIEIPEHYNDKEIFVIPLLFSENFHFAGNERRMRMKDAEKSALRQIGSRFLCGCAANARFGGSVSPAT